METRNAIKTTVLEMVAYIGTNFPVNESLYLVVYAFFEEKGPKIICEYVGKHIKPLSEYVLSKNLDFFASKKYEVFAEIPRPHVDRLSEIVLESPQEKINTLWTYFAAIIALYDIATKVKTR